MKDGLPFILAIALFLGGYPAKVAANMASIINDPNVPGVSLSRVVVDKGITLAEAVYEKDLDKGGRLTIIMVPAGVIVKNMLAYYDYRVQTIYINANEYKDLDLTYRLYLIAHEVGHHFMRNDDKDLLGGDHCQMYQPGGYDHQILSLLNVKDSYDYIDPLTSMFVCMQRDY